MEEAPEPIAASFVAGLAPGPADGPVTAAADVAFLGQAIRSMVITTPQENSSAIDTMEFRRALGHFATGVTVVTYQPEGTDEYRGTTVNSFTSVSLDPPLILVSLGRQTRASAALRPGKPFAVNVLHHGQRDLAIQFAGRRPGARPMAKGATVSDAPPAAPPGGTTPRTPRLPPGGTTPRTPRGEPDTLVEWEVRAGVPHLAGCGAHFRCVTRDVHEAGDHVLVVGLVEEFHAYGHPPLLFYRGAFGYLRIPAVPQPAAEIFTDFPELW